ncbi:MAG: hypothetical protein A2284_10900 [Deltaproteobacteria bacterium RIFOXYA12_FULL_61_11]|nr:MAG: hypothetical protein A2284_10900 [Deltaproteobacteria bacterium RIFOXYA12_FULL_61_11]
MKDQRDLLLDPTPLPPPWGRVEVAEGETTEWKLPYLTVWLRRSAGRLILAKAHRSPYLPEAPEPTPPPDRAWHTFVLEEREQSLLFSPMLPDLPVVIKPTSPLHLGPHLHTRLYAMLPLQVQVSAIGDRRRPLVILDQVRWGRTWFGDFFDGEPCLWRYAELTALPPATPGAHKALFPIEVHNLAGEELVIDKLCHRMDQLALFCTDQAIWADTTVVHYHGDPGHVSVSHQGKAPGEVPHALKVVRPRLEPNKGLVTRTFASIKHFNIFMR